MKLDPFELKTEVDYNIFSIVMVQASDVAEKLTELECELHGIPHEVEDENGFCYTDEAQGIFNIYYDEQIDELYQLLNQQLKIINKEMDDRLVG